jgi:hypothetical protein
LDFDSWQQGSYERLSRRCETVKTTRWVGTEVREHLVYDGTSNLGNFLQNMEENAREYQIVLVLNIAFQKTPARWWANHKFVLRTWDEVKQAIKYRLWNEEQLESEMQMDLQVVQLFSRELDPRIHIEQCVTQWQAVGIPSHVLVQVFPLSLSPILKYWITHEETRKQSSD